MYGQHLEQAFKISKINKERWGRSEPNRAIQNIEESRDMKEN